MRIVLLLCLGSLMVAAEAAPAAGDDGEAGSAGTAGALDPETVARAEAAADAFLADGEAAAGAPSAATPLEPQQREALARLDVLLLEAEAHLAAGQTLPAVERYLAAQELLASLPRQAQPGSVRQRLLQLGQGLLAGGHLDPEGTEPDPAPAGPGAEGSPP